MSERTLSSRRVYEGRVISLRVDDVALRSGRTATREIVEHRGAVAVVPLTPEGEVILVRQYRAATGGTLLEIPAGTLEPGEDPASALQRELAEEIGMRAATVEPLAAFFPSPGFLTEVVHLYVATGLDAHKLEAEEEDLEVVRLPLRDARAMVDRGEIRDAKSIIGLLLVSLRPPASSPGAPRPRGPRRDD